MSAAETIADLRALAQAAAARADARRDRCNGIAAEWLGHRDAATHYGAHAAALAATWRARAWCALAERNAALAWRSRAEAARWMRLAQEVR